MSFIPIFYLTRFNKESKGQHVNVVKGLDSRRQIKNLKKTTKLLSLKDMFRQKLQGLPRCKKL